MPPRHLLKERDTMDNCNNENTASEAHSESVDSLDKSNSSDETIVKTTVDESTRMDLSFNEVEGRNLFRYMLSCGRNITSEDTTVDASTMNENSPLQPDYVLKLERLAKEVLAKHAAVYKQMAEKLVMPGLIELNFAAVEELCNELFANEQISWGRIVALCALCIEISNLCKQHNLNHIALYAADSLWHCNSKRITEWIAKLPKGWSSANDIVLDEEEYGQHTKTWWSMPNFLMICAGIGLAVSISVVLLR